MARMKQPLHLVFILTAMMLLLLMVGCAEKREPAEREKQKLGIEVPLPGPLVEWRIMVGMKLPEKLVHYGNEVLFVDSIGNIIAANINDGAQRKAVHYAGPVMGWDIYLDTVAASTISKKVHCNDITTGEEFWNVPCETTPSEPAITQEGVIFSEGLGPYRVRYYSLGGTQIWQHEFAIKPGGFEPVIAENVAVIAFDDRYIRALSLADGETVWEFRVGEPLELDPDGRWADRYDFLGVEGELRARKAPLYTGGIGRMVLAGGGLMVPSEDGLVRRFDPENGNIVWEKRFDDRVTHLWDNPTFNSMLHALTAEGHFTCLNPQTGAIIGEMLLENPTLGLVGLPDGSLIMDINPDGKPILRDVPLLFEKGILDIDVIPQDGFVAGNILVARTRDGEIVGISLPRN
jgi:outer membrane protein assembly factor BamB